MHNVLFLVPPYRYVQSERSKRRIAAQLDRVERHGVSPVSAHLFAERRQRLQRLADRRQRCCRRQLAAALLPASKSLLPASPAPAAVPPTASSSPPTAAAAAVSPASFGLASAAAASAPPPTQQSSAPSSSVPDSGRRARGGRLGVAADVAERRLGRVDVLGGDGSRHGPPSGGCRSCRGGRPGGSRSAVGHRGVGRHGRQWVDRELQRRRRFVVDGSGRNGCRRWPGVRRRRRRHAEAMLARVDVSRLRRHVEREALRDPGVQRLQRVLQAQRPTETDLQVLATAQHKHARIAGPSFAKLYICNIAP